MVPFEIPSLRYSLVPGGAVERHRFVSVNSNGAGIAATASTAVVGVSMNKITVNGSSAVYPANQVLEVSDGLVMVEASAAINAGVKVAATTAGKAVTYASGTTGDACAVAITGATAAGELITVKL